jgi:hypothetical protein
MIEKIRRIIAPEIEELENKNKVTVESNSELKDRCGIVKTIDEISVYKALTNKECLEGNRFQDFYIARLTIPEGSKIVCPYSRYSKETKKFFNSEKYRTGSVIVESIYDVKNNSFVEEAYSPYACEKYEEGEQKDTNVNINMNPFEDCAEGIHFFATSDDVIEYVETCIKYETFDISSTAKYNINQQI